MTITPIAFLRLFQTRTGLVPDGITGPATLADALFYKIIHEYCQ